MNNKHQHPQKYTKEEAQKASLEYFKGEELPATGVFLPKYALRDSDDNLVEKDPDDMHHRLAREVYRIEKKYPNPLSEEKIYEYFKDFGVLIPQGSPMSAIGDTFRYQTASNCYVIPPAGDSYGGILHTDEELVQILKRRGGCGTDLSNVRPFGVQTSNAARKAEGVTAIMKRYSNSSREVGQLGRVGALMLTLGIKHPDIERFIDIKRDRKLVTGANVSLRVSDEFMHAVEKSKKFTVQWPVDSSTPEIFEEKDARSIFDKMVDAAWECAEPGVLFWDTAIRRTPSDIYTEEGFGSVSTNPCGEIILSAYDSCRLMVVNLIPFVESPFTNKARFDFEKFKEVAIDAQRIMDDIVDLDIELVDRIINKIKSENQKYSQTELELWKNVKNAAQKGRRTGLGITALGDAIAAMGLKYGSKESIKFTEEVYKTLCIGSYTSSCIMAGERGAFSVFNHEKEIGHEFLEQIWKESPETFELYKKHGRRNIANLTTAPTGSTSIVAKCWDWNGTTGGGEPAIYIKYTRKRKLSQDDTTTRVDFVDELGDRWHSYDVYHPGVKKFMEVTGKSAEESPYFGATANDIDPVSAVKIQAAGQRWLCHSISKTVNLPADVSKDVIAKIFMEAWKSGCKGVTVYRDGSRNNVLSDSSSNEKPKVEFNTDEKRPEILSCDIHRIKIKGQDWVCFVGINNEKPWELFTGLEDSILPPNKKLQHGCIVKRGAENKSKYDLYFNKGQDDEVIFKDITSHFKNEEFGSHTRLISSLMRYAPIDFVVEQLQKLDNEDMFSFIKVVSRVLKSYVKDGTKIDKKCPNCKADALFYVEGCPKCLDCGFSKC